MKRMRHSMRKSALLGVLLLTTVACNRRPDVVLDRDQMARVLVDVHKAEGMLEEQNTQYLSDDQKKGVVASVLLEHGVTKQEYDSSLVWYAQNLKELIKVYDIVEKELKNENTYWEEKAQAAMPFQTSLSGDTVDMWTQASYAILDTYKGPTAMKFAMPSDSNFLKGDTFRWQMNVKEVSSRMLAVATLSLQYSDGDMVLSKSQLLKEDGRVDLLVVGDSVGVLNFVSGTLYLSPLSDSLALQPVVVDSIRLMRYHKLEPETKDDSTTVSEKTGTKEEDVKIKDK